VPKLDRYVTIPVRSSDDWPEGECGGQTVIEAEDTFRPKPTGVLDKDGRMICRMPERIGFRCRS
jgi:hypothetical protein